MVADAIQTREEFIDTTAQRIMEAINGRRINLHIVRLALDASWQAGRVERGAEVLKELRTDADKAVDAGS